MYNKVYGSVEMDGLASGPRETGDRYRRDTGHAQPVRDDPEEVSTFHSISFFCSFFICYLFSRNMENKTTCRVNGSRTPATCYTINRENIKERSEQKGRSP